jgi:hypothetical protein
VHTTRAVDGVYKKVIKNVKNNETKKNIPGILLKAAQVGQKVNEGAEEKVLKATGGGNENDGRLECAVTHVMAVATCRW